MHTHRLLSALAPAALLLAAGCDRSPTGPGPDPVPSLTTVAVVFAGGTVKAEIAAARAQRETGLMNRTTIAADSGMLFVWPADQHPLLGAFWMRNTLVDLSIAFLDANRRVLNVEEMTRLTETFHYSVAPYRYALEAPSGWFARHGVAAGAIASFTLPAGVVIEP